MFVFAAGTELYQRIGLGLLLLQIALFIFGLPPFHVGIWLQTEPHMVTMFSLAALDSIWLLYGVMRGKLRITSMPPLWYALIAWILWQIVPTVMAEAPHRSWFGPVEMGEGMGWHLAGFIITVKAIPLWRVRFLRHIIVIWAAFIISTETVLHLLFNSRQNVYIPGVWIPAQWADYLGFMVAYFWIMVFAGDYARRPIVYAMLIIFSVIVVYSSHNDTALFLVPLAAFVSAAMRLLEHFNITISFLQPNKLMRTLAMLACVLPFSWVVFSIQYEAPVFDPNQDENRFNLANKNSALGSRIGLIQVGASALKHEPSRWLYGSGWGDYNETIFKYALVDGVHQYYKGTRQPNWLFVDGNAYHTHCAPFEALLALGLPGLILFFAIPFIFIWTVPGRLFWGMVPMMVAFYIMSFMWFQLPQCVPMLAVMMAALCVVCSKKGGDEESRAPSAKALIALTTCVIVMILSAQEQYKGMIWGDRVFRGTSLSKAEEFPLNYMLTDLYRGGDRTRVAAMGFALRLDGARGDIDMRQHDWYTRFMDVAEQMTVSPTVGPRGKHLRLWLQYKLLLNLGYPIFQELGDRAVRDMHQTVLSVVKAAPLRDDVASFYFLNLPILTDDNKDLQIRLLRDILEITPNHRSALWLLGHLLKDKPEHKEAAMAMIYKAVEHHVETVYPITDEMLAPYQ